jgi:iron complex outermembrane receptor protein
MASDQDEVFGPETRTAGYTVVNLKAAYTWNAGRIGHTITAALINAGDRVYRNHLSYIKDLAAEYGRNFRVTYTVNIF